mgnify:FL=1
MPTRLKQKDLKEGDNVYMVGIEGITSITIITPTFAGEYNLGPKFSYLNHRHGGIKDSSYHGDHNSLDNQTKKYNDRGLYATYAEAVEAFNICKAIYSYPF